MVNKGKNKDVLIKMVGYFVLEYGLLVLGVFGVVMFIGEYYSSGPLKMLTIGVGVIVCFVGSNRVGLHARNLSNTGQNPQTFI